jgi:GAF domain-containing protein
LRKDSSILGIFVIYRQEVRAFSHKQIALLQNFAAQAVIAMENARLITETREALEQQTATAEVLGVINSSPGDLAPVFDAILEKALRFCDANFGDLSTFDGVGFRSTASRGYYPGPDRPSHATPRTRLVIDAEHRVIPDRPSRPTPPTPGMAQYRLIHGEDVVHIPDITADEVYRSGNPGRRRLADEFGARTAVWVALRKENELRGMFFIYRQEVSPFSDKEIALLQNFAAQAVIAMENARLITETREALEQQTATAEVLQVINSSPGDLAPVFDAMLQKALSLCGAAFGQLVTFDGVVFRAAAWRGYEPGPSATAPSPGMALYQLLHGEQIIHIPDITADDVYRSGNAVRRR